MALNDLLTRRNAVEAELAAMSSSQAGGRPNIDGGGMGTVNHVGYRKSLYEELEMLNIQISRAEGPWEVGLECRSA